MKKRFVEYALFLALVGCTANPSMEKMSGLKIDDLSVKSQNMLTFPCTAPYENGFFYVSENYSALEFAENCEKKVHVAEMTINDDLPSSEKNHFERYTDLMTPSKFYVNNQRIWFVSMYQSIDGQSSFKLHSMAINGEDRKVEMDLPYQPIQFIVHRSTIICVEYGAESTSILHVYDNHLKEIHTTTENGPISSLFADGNEVYYIMQDNNDYRYRIQRYSLDSKKCDLVKELEVGGLGFESNGRLAYYTLSQQFFMDTDPMDIAVTSVIENMADNKILFSVTDEFIGHFDDEFIYTSTIKEKHVEYKIYD